MLPNLEDLKARLNAAMSTAVWGVVAAAALATMLGFLCAALFIWTSKLYGAIAGCLILGGVFLLVLLIALIAITLIRQRQAERAAVRAQSATAAFWRDPAILSTGLQLSKALGLKRTAPLALLAAFAVGLLLSRSLRNQGGSSPSNPDV